MIFPQHGLWKIDVVFFGAAALVVVLTSAIAVRADSTDAAAPASANGSTTLTAASPSATAKPAAPGVEPATIWDLGPHGALGLTEPDLESLNRAGSEDASQHPGAQ